jgi:hypothetical protein
MAASIAASPVRSRALLLLCGFPAAPPAFWGPHVIFPLIGRAIEFGAISDTNLTGPILRPAPR